jgi:DNA repair protein RecN (Recombination protein N)
MLQELSIAQFAIIDQLSLQFRDGLTVLSGETGAGKSIIIDALGILRGDRFDSSHIRSNCDRSRIEGIFHIQRQTHMLDLLQEHGLADEEDPHTVIILREINRDTGRAISRINGRAVNSSVLREIGSALIDIQGQHDGLALFNPKTHLDMLDRYGQLAPLRQEVSEGIQRLRATRAEIAKIRSIANQRNERIEELRQLRDDVAAAKLREDEEEQLMQERARIQNGARINELVTQAYALLTGDERQSRALIETSVVLSHTLSDLAKVDPSTASYASQSVDIQYALEELHRQVRAYRDDIEFDPRRIEAIEDRITVIRDIQRKYRSTVTELIAQAEQAELEIEQLEQSDSILGALEQQSQQQSVAVGTLALKLSQQRIHYARHLAKEVEQSAHDLAMPHVRFVVQHQTTPAEDGVIITDQSGKQVTLACDRTGIDKIEFLIAPNPGEDLKPLAKTASGGEGSRLFLALKSVLSQIDTVETMVFDEVDTGVGGRAGFVVGEKLWHIAQHHQVLCISHLAQVATFGDAHYAIHKKVELDRTTTQVTLLEGEARVDEIAAMLDGLPLTEQSRLVARDLLQRAVQLKNN